MNRMMVCSIVLAATLALSESSADSPSPTGPVGFALVTEQEAAADRAERLRAPVTNRSLDGAGGDISEEGAEGAPVIEVLSPDVSQALQSPVSFDIRFRAPPGAMIALHTVRLKYGLMGLDLTERVRNVGSVTKDGIRAHGAELPVGQHPMTIEVEDTRGIRALRRFTLNIVP